MDLLSQISVGDLNGIFDRPDAVNEPVFQCLHVKPLAAQGNSEPRYRTVYSDTVNFVQAMLATQANHYVTSGQLRRGCLVRLKKYTASKVKTKKILIVLDLEILEEFGEHDKIGDPVALEKTEEEPDVKPNTITSNGFYGNNANSGDRAQQQRALPTRNNAPSSSANANIFPIESLSPYSHKWTIKARVTHKSAIKTWHNRNGEGKLFGVNLLDDSGEIKATGFNDQCDQLYDTFQEGTVYYISSPCRVQMAKKQFTNLNNDYELTFEKDTVVEKAEEENDVPQVRFNFTSIADLQSVEKDTTIDVIAVLQDVGETSQITSKTTSKPYDKRELTLVDNTNYSVRLTIWGSSATTFDVQPESVLAFKGVKVSDFGGRSLSLLSSGSMTVDPDIEESHKLKGWFDAKGRQESFQSHAGMTGVGAATGRGDPFKTITQVRDENIGMSDKPEWFSLKATIVYIKQDNISYPACRSEGCNKKVVEIQSGEWRCERCDKAWPKPEHRYIMSTNVSDHTGQLWLSCFDESGRTLMGQSADQLMDLKENDEKGAADVFQEANCKQWNFKCKAKMDSFQEQQRVRYQVVSVSPLNYCAEMGKLADQIKTYSLE